MGLEDFGYNESVEKLWADEASRRWERYKAGEINAVSAAEVFEKYKP